MIVIFSHPKTLTNKIIREKSPQNQNFLHKTDIKIFPPKVHENLTFYFEIFSMKKCWWKAKIPSKTAFILSSLNRWINFETFPLNFTKNVFLEKKIINSRKIPWRSYNHFPKQKLKNLWKIRSTKNALLSKKKSLFNNLTILKNYFLQFWGKKIK